MGILIRGAWALSAVIGSAALFRSGGDVAKAVRWASMASAAYIVGQALNSLGKK